MKNHAFGAYVWKTKFLPTEMQGQFFDDYDVITKVRGYDEHKEDLRVSVPLWELMERRETPKMIMYHCVGLDGWLHNAGNPNHEFAKAGVAHYDHVFRELVARVDDQTTIIAFGDHGFDVDNDHGEEGIDILSTMVFVYQKSGLPMKKKYMENIEKFRKIDMNFKNVDVPASASLIMDTAFPFANFGVFHPALAPHDDLNLLRKRMVQNLE